MKPKSSHLPGKIILVVLVVLAALFATHRNQVYDWWRLRNYAPPAVVANFVQQDTMTAKARHLFYINHPSVQSRSSFSGYCPSGTEQTVVLGCYKSLQRGIYVLNVDNQELAGIEQVTAAHEMLHAAYDRLSSKDKQNVDAQLLDYYHNQLKDDTIKQTIEDYKKSEPTEVVNEMHSVFGTQIANLPAGLENYYKQYFTNRQAVTGYYQQYEKAFTGRQQQIKSYDSQLDSLKTQIDQLELSVNSQQNSLKSQRAQLDSSRGSSDATTYNRQVDAYNSAVNTYNADVRRLQSLISQYNNIVAKRNAIALEERQLVQSLSAPSQLQ